MLEPVPHLDAAPGARRRMAGRLGWVVGVLFVVVMALGADYPPPPGFVLLVVVAVVLGVVVGRLVPPLLRLWDACGALRALGRAAVVGFAGGAVIWALASTIQLVTAADGVGLGAQALGLSISGGTAALGAVAVAAMSRLLDRHTRRGR